MPTSELSEPKVVLSDPFASSQSHFRFSREEADRIFHELNQPFDAEDVKWKPQTVRNGMALAVAHADPRAYIDRLNDVLGIGGWEDHYQFIVTPFNKFLKGRAAWRDKPGTEDKFIPGDKVLCVCTLTLLGLGSKSSTGDSDAGDDNAATSAEAQAFKRACMRFGLGRYLYDLPKQNVRYEDFKFVTEPTLPDWAIPKTACEACTATITSQVFEDKEYSVPVLIANSVKKYNQKLCMECQRKRNADSAVSGRKK
jgi:hypothetical protein